MKLEKIIAKDIQGAIKATREKLGPDAVILSTQSVKDGIQILATNEYIEESSTSESIIQDVSSHEDQEVNISKMHNEIKTLKELLEEQLAQLVWKDKENKSPLKVSLLRHLKVFGVEESIAEFVVSQLDSTNVKSFESALNKVLLSVSQSLKVYDDEMFSLGKVYFFIGSAGVGKTSVLAKIAARLAVSGHLNDVAIINYDQVKVGSFEQIRAIASLIGVDVFNAKNADELSALVEALSDKIVLVDMPGTSYGEPDLSKLKLLLAENLKRLLVLPANSKYSDITLTISRCERDGIDACILTKLDEAASLGEPISAIIKGNLPLLYVTDGTQIVESIHNPKPVTLMQKMVKLGRAHNTNHSELIKPVSAEQISDVG